MAVHRRRTAHVKVSGNARVTVTGLRATSKALKSAGSGAAAGDLGKRLKEAGELVAVIARQKAAFSSRIPGSIKVTGGRSGVSIAAGSAKAPHAEAFELGKKHPLFGNRGYWYPTAHIPFLEDAADEGADGAAVIVARVVDDWAREYGFR
jgi:hypothetical protein